MDDAELRWVEWVASVPPVPLTGRLTGSPAHRRFWTLLLLTLLLLLLVGLLHVDVEMLTP